jgi:hypothetical protein
VYDPELIRFVFKGHGNPFRKLGDFDH